MGHRRQSGDLYRPVYKEGTYLAPSKNTEGAVRGSLFMDVMNPMTTKNPDERKNYLLKRRNLHSW